MRSICLDRYPSTYDVRRHPAPPHVPHHPYPKPLHACPRIHTHSTRVSTSDTRQDPLPQSRAGPYRPQPSSCPPSGLQPASTSPTQAGPIRGSCGDVVWCTTRRTHSTAALSSLCFWPGLPGGHTSLRTLNALLSQPVSNIHNNTLCQPHLASTASLLLACLCPGRPLNMWFKPSPTHAHTKSPSTHQPPARH